jgi:hypothetical protein
MRPLQGELLQELPHVNAQTLKGRQMHHDDIIDITGTKVNTLAPVDIICAHLAHLDPSPAQRFAPVMMHQGNQIPYYR